MTPLKKHYHHFTIVILFAILLSSILFLDTVAGQGELHRANQSTDGIWYDIEKANMHAQGERLIVPDSYRVLGLDVDELQALLVQAPMEDTRQVAALRSF